MKKVIHYLRRQPEEVRRHVLHSLTIVFGVVLLLLWIYSLGSTLTDQNLQKELKADTQPISVLKDNIPEAW